MKKIIITILFMSALFSQGNDRYGTFISTWYDAILMATDTTANGVIGGQWIQDGRGNLTNICIDGINGRAGFGKLSPEYQVDVLGILKADSLMGDTVIVNYLILPDVHQQASIGTASKEMLNVYSTNSYITNQIFATGDLDTYIDFTSDNDITLRAGGYTKIVMNGTGTSYEGNYVRVGVGGTNTDVYLASALWVDTGNSTVEIAVNNDLKLQYACKFIFTESATDSMYMDFMPGDSLAWYNDHLDIVSVLDSLGNYSIAGDYVLDASTDFRLSVVNDTLCSIFSTDTLRIHPPR